MGVRFPSVFTTTLVAAVPANGAETVCYTTPPLTLPLDSAAVFLHWYVACQTGTGTNQVRVIIRRGTLVTSPAVTLTTDIQNVVAVANQYFSGCFVDIPGAAAGVQYSLTMQGNNTTGAFVNYDGALLAFAL